MSDRWPTDAGASPPWEPPGSQPSHLSGSPFGDAQGPDHDDRHDNHYDDRRGRGGVRRRGRTSLLVAAVIVVMALVVTGVVSLARDVRGREAARGPETSVVSLPGPTVTSPEVSPPGRGAGGTGDAEFDKVLEELSRFVEAERDLEFKDHVDVELLDGDRFEQRLMEAFDEDADEYDRTGAQLIALGLLDKGTDLEEEMRSLLGAGVLGFYDPETKELVVRGSTPTPYTRQTIAHELTHALDDQWFDLDRPELESAKDESAFGLSALAEGDARRVEDAYTSTMSVTDRRTLQREEQEFAAASVGKLSKVPPVLIDMIMAPYDYGSRLVREVVARSGEAGVDESFLDIPTTTEQVMDPDRYLDGEKPIPVDTPPAEGEVTDDGMFGQMMIYLVLKSKLDDDTAAEAAEGWGGDHYVSWSRPDRTTCLRVDIVTDTARDMTELVGALRVWARGRSGAVVEPSGSKVRLTSCA